MKRSTPKRKTYLKKVPMKRKAPKALKRPAAKKKKRVNLWDLYGVQKPSYTRYSGLQGVLWCLVSQYVRQVEFKEYDGYCVDGCGRRVERWQDADCGHFRSARSLATRFSRENLGLQTKYCNSPRGGNGNQYAFGKAIDQRYGAGTADKLTELAQGTSAPFKDAWYDAEIRKYKALLETVDSENFAAKPE